MTTTASTITTKQIKTLRHEAVAAGDYLTADYCDLALSTHETADAEGGNLIDPVSLEPTTRSAAREQCARAIAAAEAQVDG